MPATKKPSKSTFALPLLVCVALMVAMVGGAKYRETATGVGYWAWLACGLVPLGAMVGGTGIRSARWTFWDHAPSPQECSGRWASHRAGPVCGAVPRW